MSMCLNPTLFVSKVNRSVMVPQRELSMRTTGPTCGRHHSHSVKRCHSWIGPRTEAEGYSIWMQGKLLWWRLTVKLPLSGPESDIWWSFQTAWTTVNSRLVSTNPASVQLHFCTTTQQSQRCFFWVYTLNQTTFLSIRYWTYQYNLSKHLQRLGCLTTALLKCIWLGLSP